MGLSRSTSLALAYALGGKALRAWVEGVPRHTDDHPILEYRAPRSLYSDTARENRRRVLDAARAAERREPFTSLVRSADGPALAERAAVLEKSGSFGLSFEIYASALAREPRHGAAAEGLARTAARIGSETQAQEILRRMASGPAPGEGQIGLAVLFEETGDLENAMRALEAAADVPEVRRKALVRAGGIQASLRDAEATDQFAEALLQADAGDSDAHALRGFSRLLEGRFPEAGREAALSLRREPGHRRALSVAAVSAARRGDRDQAQLLFEKLLEVDADSPAAWTDFGVFVLETGQPREAARLFEQAVDLSRNHVGAWRGLREAARRSNDRRLEQRAERGLKRAEAALAADEASRP